MLSLGLRLIDSGPDLRRRRADRLAVVGFAVRLGDRSPALGEPHLKLVAGDPAGEIAVLSGPLQPLPRHVIL